MFVISDAMTICVGAGCCEAADDHDAEENRTAAGQGSET